MNGKWIFGNAEGISEWMPALASDSSGAEFAGLKPNLNEKNKTTIVHRLPDGRIIIITRNLPTASLGA